MHRPFVRAALVMVVLICSLVMHGHHADHAAGPAAEAVVAAHGAVPVDSGTPVGGHTVSDPADQWADDGHPPHGDGCGTGLSVSAAHAGLAPPVVGTPVVLYDDVTIAAAGPQAVSDGRALLLLHCVSRT